MPIYEYKCQRCGASIEAIVRNRSDEPEKCPRCGGEELIREMSTFAAPRSGGAPECDAAGCGFDPASCGRDLPCGKGSCVR